MDASLQQSARAQQMSVLTGDVTRVIRPNEEASFVELEEMEGNPPSSFGI